MVSEATRSSLRRYEIKYFPGGHAPRSPQSAGRARAIIIFPLPGRKSCIKPWKVCLLCCSSSLIWRDDFQISTADFCHCHHSLVSNSSIVDLVQKLFLVWTANLVGEGTKSVEALESILQLHQYVWCPPDWSVTKLTLCSTWCSQTNLPKFPRKSFTA